MRNNNREFVNSTSTRVFYIRPLIFDALSIRPLTSNEIVQFIQSKRSLSRNEILKAIHFLEREKELKYENGLLTKA